MIRSLVYQLSPTVGEAIDFAMLGIVLFMPPLVALLVVGSLAYLGGYVVYLHATKRW